MNRIVNELTSDEVQRGTGVKVGDFGTGGRTYVKRYTAAQGQEGKNNALCCKIIGVILALVVAGMLFATETNLHSVIVCLDEALHTAKTVREPVADPANVGKLVHVVSPVAPTLAGSEAKDDFFGISFGKGVGSARRVTEYCQWQEMEHRHKVKEGEERGPDGKVREKFREETTYTYYKAWRSHRVSSLMFDNPVAYHNPQADPAPSRDIQPAGGIDLSGGRAGNGNGLVISGADFAEGLLAEEAMPLYRDQVEKLRGSEALVQGFGEADHRYVYRRVPKDGFTGNPLVKAAAAYLVDGVLDVGMISSGIGAEGVLDKAGLGWITRGSCHAGDIRVSFAVRKLPSTATVIAMQTGDNRLIPATYTSGDTRIFARPSMMELPQFVGAVVKDEKWSAMLWRAGAAVVALIASFCIATGFEMEFSGATFFVAGALAPGTLGLVWLYIHGVKRMTPLALIAVSAVVAVVIYQKSGSKAPVAPAAAQQAQPHQDNRAAYEAERDNKKNA